MLLCASRSRTHWSLASSTIKLVARRSKQLSTSSSNHRANSRYCTVLRGKPSSRTTRGEFSVRTCASIRSAVKRSGTIAPAASVARTCALRVLSSRKRSPAHTLGNPYFFRRRCVCVPFPAPGGPQNTRKHVRFKAAACGVLIVWGGLLLLEWWWCTPCWRSGDVH